MDDDLRKLPRFITLTRGALCAEAERYALARHAFLIFSSERVRPGVVPSESVIFMYRCHHREREYDDVMRNCRVLVRLRAFPT